MDDAPAEHRFYGELAVWWPLISPPEDYAEEAAYAAALLESAHGPVREVLELGSGGGHVALYLKQRFAMTLVDLSADMLAVSRRLNPECEHVQGDMRSLRLGRAFDAVFVHDAVDYMTTEADLRRAIATAFAHCRPGGVAVFVPDQIEETFAPASDHGGSDGADGRGVRFLEWSWDPVPGDGWALTEYVFLLRDAGRLRALRPRDPPRRRLRACGLAAIARRGRLRAGRGARGDQRGPPAARAVPRPPLAGRVLDQFDGLDAFEVRGSARRSTPAAAGIAAATGARVATAAAAESRAGQACGAGWRSSAARSTGARRSTAVSSSVSPRWLNESRSVLRPVSPAWNGAPGT